jgi:hypothetical protein
MSRRRKSSGSGMAENPRHLGVDLVFGPIGVQSAQAGAFHFARRPIELLRQSPSTLARHGAQKTHLLGSTLFVRQHVITMSGPGQPGKSENHESRGKFNREWTRMDTNFNRRKRGNEVVTADF